MNKFLAKAAVAGVSAILAISAVSCSKEKRNLDRDLKDVAEKTGVFEKQLKNFEDSIGALKNAEGSRSKNILSQEMDGAIESTLKAASKAAIDAKVSALANDSTGAVSNAGSLVTEVATKASVAAQEEILRMASVDKFETDVRALEQSARNAVRGSEVSSVKSEISKLVSEENKNLDDYKALVEKGTKELEKAIPSINSKYVKGDEKTAILDARTFAILCSKSSAALNKAEDGMIKDIVSSKKASLSSEARENIAGFEEQLDSVLSDRIAKVQAKYDLAKQRISEYKAIKGKLENLRKNIGSSKDPTKEVSNLEVEYRKVVNDFAAQQTEIAGLLVSPDSVDDFVKKEATGIIAAFVAENITPVVEDLINDNVAATFAANLSGDEKEKLAQEVNKSLDDTIRGQCNDAISKLERRVSAFVSEVKNLRKFRDEIAKRVPIVKNPVNVEEMVSLKAGTIHDSYGDWDNPRNVAAFSLGKYEVTYGLWYDVYQWALSHGYKFGGAGYEGSDFDTYGIAPTERGKFQPVTGVTASDALLWLNAYSEKSGKTPVYTMKVAVQQLEAADSEAQPAAAMEEILPVRETGYSMSSVTVDSKANGFRFPTTNELLYAGAYFNSSDKGSINGKSDYGWTWYNSDTGTHSVATKKAVQTVYRTFDKSTGKLSKESAGVSFYDLQGNASEYATNNSGEAQAYEFGGSWTREGLNEYPYVFHNSFMKAVYKPNTQGLRVAQNVN